MIPGIRWSKGNEKTLIIQKSTVIPPSPMVLLMLKKAVDNVKIEKWKVKVVSA